MTGVGELQFSRPRSHARLGIGINVGEQQMVVGVVSRVYHASTLRCNWESTQ